MLKYICNSFILNAAGIECYSLLAPWGSPFIASLLNISYKTENRESDKKIMPKSTKSKFNRLKTWLWISAFSNLEPIPANHGSIYW